MTGGQTVLERSAIEAPTTASDDPRVGHILSRCVGANTQVVIIGFRCDEGVRRNGGRVGASQAPDAIREALYRMTPCARRTRRHTRLLERTADLGNLLLSGELERDQEALGKVVAEHLEVGRSLVVLGGGHETSYGHFLGYVEARLEVEILNWDAHPDVRPYADGSHSGSPFRQALEHPTRACRGYTVAGLESSSVARSHLDYVRGRGGTAVFRDELEAAPQGRMVGLYDCLSDPSMVSFDLDAVGASWAPGVSAPAVRGLRADLWLAAAEEAGRRRAVRSVDVVELNPSFDVSGVTAKLAALTVWRFLLGRARPSVGGSGRGI